METKPLKEYGLIPEMVSKHQPTTHQVFGSVSLPDIKPLQLPDILGPTDQKSSSFCYAYTVRQLCSDQDGIVYDENWIVAMTSRLLNAAAINGAPALTAMESAIEYGALALTDLPAGMTWEEKGAQFIADWKNWSPDLYLKAAPHEKVAVLNIDGPYDHFDNLRSAIQLHQRHAALATKWFQAFNQVGSDGFIPSTLLPSIKGQAEAFSWHMYEAMDFDTINGVDIVRVKPHEGASYGKDGLAYFDRDTINFLLAEPLANDFMFGDVPQSLLQRILLQHVSLEEIFREIVTRIENKS